MGRLKQLLSYRGQPLVQHAIEEATNAGLAPIIAVVGAEGAAVRAAIAGQPVSIVENREWASGMGSSIAAGMRFLAEAASDVAAVAILLADQPLVTARHLVKMQTLVFSGKSQAVAAQYSGSLGVPAIFKRNLFEALSSLPSAAGARHILRDSEIEVAAFPLPEAAIDIDTPEDFAALESPGGAKPPKIGT